MRKRLADWFPGDVAPVRAGVYQVDGGGVRWYRWINTDGAQYVGGSSPEGALRCVLVDPIHTRPLPWRGLAERSE